MPGPFLLAPLLALCAALLIRAEFARDRRAIALLKAPSTVLAGSIAGLSLLPASWGAAPAYSAGYTQGVLIGLAFCLLGDLALMRHEDERFFAAGLAFFLAAQSVFAAHFALAGAFAPVDLISAGALLGFAIFFFLQFRRTAGRLAPAVLLYMLVVSAMVNRALGLFNNPELPAATAGLAAAGALLFWVSDLILALNRFWRPMERHQISLAFYYAALLAFGLSCYKF